MANFLSETTSTTTSTTTSATTSSTTSTTTPTTTATYDDLHELRGGFVGASEAYGNVFAVNSNVFFGPVCGDDNWGGRDVYVLCRQLGYSYGHVYKNSHWGSVPDDFAMADVRCNGEEMYLQECSYSTSDDCGPNALGA